ncbi:NYN domain-containing protein [Devosia sp. ZB163]|uniref:NYN domain-containing protein n=1 Tax=Devosia sp. ZB163 TaxID=3025938 RepID=UPI0023628005|nr:NYN domain-containing protein [Devosia sp. ZB163]MDC9823981.1 NYN domain-containing protein [Devosia sp. ZB163]
MAGKEWLDYFSRTTSSRNARCAVLVDGDNVPPRLTGALVRYASSLGRVTSIEVFANFASSHAAGWSAQMKEHGVIGFQHYRTSNGKNAADTSLIVRAMDLIHTERPDHYVLISSDSDFSALAHRIRRSGATVHGVGHASAAASLRASCSSFLTFDELSSLILSTGAAAGTDVWKRPPSDAEDRVLNALVRLGAARQWVDISKLGQELREASPTFDPRFYGSRSLRELCDAIDSVEVDREEANPKVRIALPSRNGSVPDQTTKS